VLLFSFSGILRTSCQVEVFCLTACLLLVIVSYLLISQIVVILTPMTPKVSLFPDRRVSCFTLWRNQIF
jgi:hypothetical protein